MRLNRKEQEAIKLTCLEVFGTDEVYVFGSRVDDSERGGDIDLYIVPNVELIDTSRRLS